MTDFVKPSCVLVVTELMPFGGLSFEFWFVGCCLYFISLL
jgi:hypothetical protein